MRNNRGFSIPEMLVSSTLLLIIVITIYFLISSTQATHMAEGRKLDMNQASRAFEQMVCDNIRSAGSVLSLLHTPTFVGSPVAFNGIYPLNNTGFPDGIILASGDPKGVTKTTGDFLASTNPTSISVDSVVDPDDPFKAVWQKDDIGMVSRAEGYFIFKVTVTPSTADTSLNIRSTPVYYSGLLNTANYNDLADEHNSDANKAGNAYTYPVGCPVIRLEYFNMFLTKVEGGSRILTLTTDTEGVGDIFNAVMTTTRGVPVFHNIEDLQFEYVSSDIPAELWASAATTGTVHTDPCASSSSTTCTDFMGQFQSRNIGAVRVYALFKTEEEVNKPQGSGIEFAKPVMGDAIALTIPPGRFHYTYMKYEVATRNYLILY